MRISKPRQQTTILQIPGGTYINLYRYTLMMTRQYLNYGHQREDAWIDNMRGAARKLAWMEVCEEHKFIHRPDQCKCGIILQVNGQDGLYQHRKGIWQVLGFDPAEALQ